MAGPRRRIRLCRIHDRLRLALTCALEPARSDDVSDFYAGRNIQLIIGYATGRRL